MEDTLLVRKLELAIYKANLEALIRTPAPVGIDYGIMVDKDTVIEYVHEFITKTTIDLQVMNQEPINSTQVSNRDLCEALKNLVQNALQYLKDNRNTVLDDTKAYVTHSGDDYYIMVVLRNRFVPVFTIDSSITRPLEQYISSVYDTGSIMGRILLTYVGTASNEKLTDYISSLKWSKDYRLGIDNCVEVSDNVKVIECSVRNKKQGGQ